MNVPHRRDALGSVLLETGMPDEFDWRGSADHLIPRPWLARVVEDFTRDPEGSGMLLITGDPGSGKTGFVRKQLDERTGPEPVAHFITSEYARWDNPEWFFGSLCAQLRRKHRLGMPRPPKEGWHGERRVAAAQKFLTLLDDVSWHLQESSPQSCEVIWLDALNIAYAEDGPGGDALDDLIQAGELSTAKKLTLPTGIYCILTSVDGPNLKTLRSRCQRVVNLKHHGELAHRIDADIARFFDDQGFTPAQAAPAIAAVEGNFLFARFWAANVPKGGGGEQPKTLDDVLELVLRRTAEDWQREARIATFEEAALEVLDLFGLLACTREPLTFFLIETLLEPARGERLRDFARVAGRTRLLRLTGLNEEMSLRFFHGYIAGFLLKKDEDLRADSLLLKLRRQLTEKRNGGDLIQKWNAELAAACHRGKEKLFAARARGGKLEDARATSYAMRHLCLHLRMACDWPQLGRELTDARFLLAKLETNRGGIFELLQSLQNALSGSPEIPADDPQRAAVNVVHRALRPHAQLIAEEPMLALQLILNETPESKKMDEHTPATVNPWTGAPRELREQRWYTAIEEVMKHSSRPWLQTRHPSTQAGYRPETILRHRSALLAVAFAPGSGKPMVASVGEDHRLRISREGQAPGRIVLPGPMLRKAGTAEDSTDRNTAHRPRQRPFPPTGLAFVLGGTRIAVATDAGIVLVDPSAENLDGVELAIPAGAARRVHSLVAAPSLARPLVLVGGEDGIARVFDLSSRETVALLDPASDEAQSEPAEGKPGKYCCVALSQEGTLAAVSHPDQTISVWELDIAGYLQQVKLHHERVRARGAGEKPWPVLGKRRLHHLPAPDNRQVDFLAFSPCGKMLAAGGGIRRGIVELWRLEKRECLCVHAHRNAVWAGTFAHDPTPGLRAPEIVLITGSFDRTVAVLKLSDIVLREEIEKARIKSRPLRGAGLDQQSYTIKELPDPLVPTVRLAHGDVVMTVAVSSDNTQLATGGQDDCVHLWQLRELLGQAPSVQNIGAAQHAGFLHAAAFDPHGQWLAAGGDDGIVRLWKVEGGQAFSTADLGGLPIRSLRFSPDGQRLAIGAAQSSAICHLHADGRILARETRRADEPIFALAFATGDGSPGHFVADSRGLIFHHLGDRTVAIAHPHQAAVRALDLSPDGRHLVSVDDESKLIVSDLTAERDGPPPLRIREHRGRIKSAIFSPCGKWLATGGQETIRLWDTATWTVSAILREHRAEIWALAFSPDGRLLASGSHDATARLWNLATKRRVYCLPCSNSVLAVQFSADSKALRVADAGPGGGIPTIHVADLRNLPC